MGNKTITLQIPDEVYESLQETAEAVDRSLEDVVMESINVMFQKPVDQAALDAQLAALPKYTDAQLWAVTYRRMPWTQSLRLRELNAKNKEDGLNDGERAELDELLDLVDRYMLVRSEALILLKRRGQEVSRYFKIGA